MQHAAYRELTARAGEDSARQQTIAYLADQMASFLKPKERVLICFPEHKEGNLSWLMEQAVLRCGAESVLWGPDRRWKTLLQQAFFSRASTIIGPPLIVLGLSKLKRYNGTPLYIRKVVTAGYPCLDWMIDGIIRGFDCTTWGSFGLGTTGVVAGFSCGHSRGVHMREDAYGVKILDLEGNVLPDGQTGQMVLYSQEDHSLRFDLGERGYIERKPCVCGRTSPRLMGMFPEKTEDPQLADLGQYLQSWTSVLDCSIRRGDYGLELEMVVFPGEKLPKLPSCARQIVRPWDPKHDEPFFYEPSAKNENFYSGSY